MPFRLQKIEILELEIFTSIYFIRFMVPALCSHIYLHLLKRKINHKDGSKFFLPIIFKFETISGSKSLIISDLIILEFFMSYK